MQIGICFGFAGTENDPHNLEKLKRALDIGYDYIEPSGWNICSYGDAEFAQIVREAKQAGIRFHSANGMLPAEVKTAGPDMDLEKIGDYCQKLYKRLQMLDIKYIVFGSGGSKQLPDGYDKEKGYDDLEKSSRLMATLAAPYDIAIAMEPLSYNEVNIMNTVQEGFEMVKRVDHPNFKLLADIYHVHHNEEALSDWSDELIKSLVHIHYANPITRKCSFTEDDYSVSFAGLLKKHGYQGNISFEGGIDDSEKDAIENLRVMRKLFS